MKIPPIVFKIVWPILYLFLIIAISLFYAKPPSDYNLYVLIQVLFWTGIVLNICWSPVFFYFKNRHLALFMLVTMIILGFLTLILFSTMNTRFKNVISILYLIYIAWLCFALYIFDKNEENKN